MRNGRGILRSSLVSSTCTPRLYDELCRTSCTYIHSLVSLPSSRQDKQYIRYLINHRFCATNVKSGQTNKRPKSFTVIASMFQQLSHVILYLTSKPPNAVKCNLAESANCIFRGVTVRGTTPQPQPSCSPCHLIYTDTICSD